MASFKVELTHPEMGTVITKTRDLSDGGAFVFTSEDQIPQVNSRIRLKVIGLPGEPAKPLESEVVRVEDEGIGVRFIIGEIEADVDLSVDGEESELVNG